MPFYCLSRLLILTCIIHTVPLRKDLMAVHQRKHSDDDAECSKSYFQRGRASIALRCCQLALAVGTSMNNAG